MKQKNRKMKPIISVASFGIIYNLIRLHGMAQSTEYQKPYTPTTYFIFIEKMTIANYSPGTC